ncbi:MAG: hypothetical protein ACR2RL_09855, partial [Gammaproteobacteria bacterium]
MTEPLTPDIDVTVRGLKVLGCRDPAIVDNKTLRTAVNLLDHRTYILNGHAGDDAPRYVNGPRYIQAGWFVNADGAAHLGVASVNEAAGDYHVHV